MRVAWLLCLLQLRLTKSQFDATNSSSNKTKLYIAFMTSFGGQYNSSGTVPAVEMALEQINSRTDVLSDYTLSLYEGMVGDSQVYKLHNAHYNNTHDFACCANSCIAALFFIVHR